MATITANFAHAGGTDRFTSPADFSILERMIERYGLPAVLTEMATLASMAGNEAAQCSRRSRNADRRANLELQAELFYQASEALVCAERAAASAVAVAIDAPVG